MCAQLDSLLIQEGVELKVLVRDDGSSDSTWDLLIAYKDLLSEEAVWLISRFVFQERIGLPDYSYCSMERLNITALNPISFMC